METVWKYSIIEEVNLIQMPKDAKILTVQGQNGLGALWALVQSENILETRTFRVVGTGTNAGLSKNDVYIGTFQNLGFVWHLWEIK